MFAKRDVEDRTSPKYRLRVRELAETPFAVIRTHAGVTGTVERYAFDHHVDTDLVDTSAAELLRLHDAVRPALVFGKHVHRQGMLAFGDGIHERIDFCIFVGYDGQERTEEFVLHDLLVLIHGIDDGRCIFARRLVACASKDDAVAVLVR